MGYTFDDEWIETIDKSLLYGESRCIFFKVSSVSIISSSGADYGLTNLND